MQIGTYIAIFDADHAPGRDFLTRTLGYFEDPKLGFVQTPQDFYNLDSFQHRRRGTGNTFWTEQSLFFRVIQRGKDYWNAAFFCGSCAVVRRSAYPPLTPIPTARAASATTPLSARCARKAACRPALQPSARDW